MSDQPIEPTEADLPEPVQADPAEIEKANQEIHDAYEHIAGMISSGIPALVDNHGDNEMVMLTTLKLHQELIRQLKVAEELLTTTIIDNKLVPFGGKNFDSVGFVEIHRTGAKTRTDNPLIASKVKAKLTAQIATDEETGEINEDVEAAVDHVVDTMVQLTGAHTQSFNGWRKKVAQSLDININDYETKEGGRLVVTIQ